ncbi:19676_t:CDS:2 [Funneliformis geosporum]|nr:19676_t:CDS:2 [Funneliformis geosporum]
MNPSGEDTHPVHCGSYPALRNTSTIFALTLCLLRMSHDLGEVL